MHDDGAVDGTPTRYGLTKEQHLTEARLKDDEAYLYYYGNPGDAGVAYRARDMAAWHRRQAAALEKVGSDPK